MAFLELHAVAKSYPTPAGRHAVLRRIDLAVDEGEFLAVIGASGSGKTTLVSIIAGLVTPDDGTVLFGGAPVVGPGPDRGVIFQNYSLLPWLTVEENVQLAVDAVARDRSPAWRRVRARHFVDLVNLSAAAHKRPRELSGGMRQRVAVARGLAMEPRLLLLDEPLSALDALTRATLQSELARIWAAERHTAILITNDIDEAVLLADRIVTLGGRDGAEIGASIPVHLPRPRGRRDLSRLPEYQRIRRALVDRLGSERMREAS